VRASDSRKLGDLRRTAGELKIVGLDQVEAAIVEISATSATEGPLTMRVQLTPQGKIRSIQIMVGG